jgi:hypothetical protein
VFGASNGVLSRTIVVAPGATNVRVNVSAYTSGTANGQISATNASPMATLITAIDGQKTTYRVALQAFTPIASSTSPFFSLQGSSTKTVRVTKVKFMCTAATGGAADLWCEKFSVLTGGTSSAPTVGLLDSNDAAQTAVPAQYTVVPSTATAIGSFLETERYEIVTAAVSVLPQKAEWFFGSNAGARAIVLRGTAQYFGLGISSIATTPVSDVVIEWTEE